MTKHVLITGGASGLGLALAKQYLSRGDKVLICDVNQQAGEEALGSLSRWGDAQFVRCDITSQADIDHLLDQVKTNWGTLDILVNNAGVATGGALQYEDIEQWEWVLNINLLGLVRMTRAFEAVLSQNPAQTSIINIASQAGLTPIPVMGSYNASKAAVISFSETMHLELCAKGIRVSVACPSFFATNLDKSLRTKQPGIAKLLGKLFSKSDLTAAQVAQTIIQQAEQGTFMILTHKAGKMAHRLKRYLSTRRYMTMMKDKTKQLEQLSD